MTLTVRNILEEKGFDVWVVQPDTSLEDTLRMMAERKIGFVPVVESEKIVGVYSERDFARLMATREDIPLHTPVRELMVHPVYFINADQTIEECMTVMSAMHFRHLPVMDGGKLVGVVSIGDVVKRLMLEREYTIQELENLLWANLV